MNLLILITFRFISLPLKGTEIIHKEDAKRGHGSCADLKWATGISCGETFLYAGFDAGFGNGRVASYVLRNGGIYPISKLQIGSPVRIIAFRFML